MINRIILIGNGFDLAHGMKTSYWDFMYDYWRNSFAGFHNTNAGVYKNDEFEIIEFIAKDAFKDHKEFLYMMANSSRVVKRLNSFFFKLSTHLHRWDWVDVEQAYYEELLLCKSHGASNSNFDIKVLNQDFEKIKILLEKYLIKIEENTKVNKRIINSIKSIVREDFNFKDFSENGLRKFSDELLQKLQPYFSPVSQNDPSYLSNFEKMIVLNSADDNFSKASFFKYLKGLKMPFDKLSPLTFLTFNYTKTEQSYVDDEIDEVIHIHGELNNTKNSIIFGYGDELDDNFKEIEKLIDNDYLDNVKSINYANTDNYKRLLQTINSGLFQVYVLGHSCGNSDRTLLNTIFEHENCVSIKPFYYKMSETADDYLKIYKNISRNFNDKAKLRDRVVNKMLCRPLLPLDIQKEVVSIKS
ncbi:Bacteriophage abortive infection AbiH [Chryseobacterium formosense]|uniref:AbiH family protein n=1 Tax=Chryseobacterium formosense TaxID=236814 RepID=UPI0008E4E0FE|nr:AbiH family protein [Chryseobacterium formosense]SFT59798.1 Bacteriophage abortive infection AbiH [Chryseobacterium formosense]